MAGTEGARRFAITTLNWYKKIRKKYRKVFDMFSHLPDTIVYVRHPECRHNLGFAEYDKAIKEGVTNHNSPITERGKKQTEITSEYLKRVFGKMFDLGVASDFTRTHAIPTELGLDFIVDSRIGERWHGELHERGSDYFKDSPEERQKFYTDYYNYRARGGENCPDVEDRILNFLFDEKQFISAKLMLTSGHGISGLCFRKVLLQASLDDWWHWYNDERLDNASVSVFKKSGDNFELIMWNYVPWEGLVPDRETMEA